MRWLGLLLAIAGVALADGGMVVPPDEMVEEYGQVAIIKHFDRVEELSIATQFHATSGFAWIVPLPSQPEVDSFDQGLLYELREHCRPLYRGVGNGCACGYAELGGGYMGEDGRGVEEVESGVIGDWEWRLFWATEAETLTEYFESMGYRLPGGMAQALDHYIDKGWNWFVVARVVDSFREYYSHVGIRFTFDTDSIVYPLYISRISAYSWTDVVLYVLAEHRQMFDGSKLKFSGSVDEHTFPGYPGFVESESHLTKLYRSYEPGDMEDICLRQAPTDEEFRAIEFYGSRDGTTGMFAMLCIALVLRGRRKRRPA
jgi:hypothetical protein